MGWGRESQDAKWSGGWMKKTSVKYPRLFFAYLVIEVMNIFRTITNQETISRRDDEMEENKKNLFSRREKMKTC